MSGLLFVIAPEADEKSINRCLLNLKDWEFGNGDIFHIVTSKSTDALLQCLTVPPHLPPDSMPQMQATSAPIPPTLIDENEWAGASISDVEAFCLELGKTKTRSINYMDVVVLDAKGIDEQTCVVMDRPCDPDDIAHLDHFEMCRFPWYQTYRVWCNLEIGILGWDEYMKETRSKESEKRWRDSNVRDEGEFLSDENRKLRNKVIKQLRNLDKA